MVDNKVFDLVRLLLLSDYKLTITCDENFDHLQTTHYPMLSWLEHRHIDSLFKKEELLVEKVIHEIVILRTVQRLKVRSCQ